MAPQRKNNYEIRAKYSKLDGQDDDEAKPVQPSLDENYPDDSSDEEDLDEFDPLDYDAGTLKKRKDRTSRKAADPNGKLLPTQRKSWVKRWLIPSRFCCSLILLFTVTVLLLLSVGGIWVLNSAPRDGQSPPWYPTPLGGTDVDWAESYSKAAELVKQMMLVEKVNITTGTGWSMGMCVGNTGPVERLDFPSLCLQDGPLGIRFADNITAFPAGITVGATWNKDLMFQRGQAHAREARGKGVNVILGPSMGPLGRSPLGGRNWEGFGSDPVLQGIASAQTIKGIQSEGVMATAKHFIGNEQEHFRQSWEWGKPNSISSNIDDRTLHELYAWPFAESIRAGVAAIMCSYNQVNNSYACQNSLLMNGIAKDEMGFQGFIMSDWLAQRSGVASALAGLDMSMPGDGLRWQDGKALWGSELTTSILNGSVPMERLDDMVTRIVAAWYKLGQDDKTKWPLPPEGGPNFSSWTNNETGLLHPGSDDKATGIVNRFKDVQGDHGRLARQTATEGIVLVKNEGDILPLSRAGWPDGKKPTDGSIKYRVGIFGEDARLNQNGINWCPDRGCNTGTLASGWGSGAVEFPYLISPLEAIRNAFDDETVYVTDYPHNKITKHYKAAQDIVSQQDLCIVFINADGGEGYISSEKISGDRNDLWAQKGGDQLATHVGNHCGNGTGDVIIVIHSIGPVLVENFADLPNVKAILYANLPGQESGNALVDVLFGDMSPCGALPYTVGKNLSDYGPGAKILTTSREFVPQQNFSEGLFIDYRYFDYHDITPRYEFGFGLTYTRFHLSRLMVQRKVVSKTALPRERPYPPVEPPKYDSEIPDPKDALFPKGFRKLKKYIYPYICSISAIVPGKPQYPPDSGPGNPSTPSQSGGASGGNPDLYTVVAEVSALLANIGNRDASAIVQLYVRMPQNYKDEETGEEIVFPVRQLRNWEKVFVEKGASRKLITMQLTRKDLSYWSPTRQNWVMPTLTDIGIELGFSSRDIKLQGTF